MADKTDNNDKTRRVPSAISMQNMPTPPSQAAASYDASGQSFAARLQKLCADFDSLRQDSAGIQAYEEVCVKLTQATTEIQEKNDMISRLEAENEQLKNDNQATIRAFETRFKSLDADKSQPTQDTEEFQALRIRCQKYEKKAEDAVKDTRKLRFLSDAYRAEAESLDADLASHRNKLEMKSLQMRQKTEELFSCRDLLKAAQGDLGRLALDPAKTRDAFVKLSSQIHDIIWGHFNRDIPDPTASVTVDGPLFRIPLLPSDTLAARSMRCAFAEAVVAQELGLKIFRDEYLVDDDAQAHLHGLFQSLKWLDREHPALATVVRCQVAKISEGSMKMQALPAQAAYAVRDVLRPWFRGDINREEALTESLQVIFYDALMLWKDLQRTAQRAEAIVVATGPIWDLATDAKPDYDDIVTVDGTYGPPHSDLMEPLAILFPKIFLGAEEEGGLDDGEDNILFHGWALFSTQAAVVASYIEWERYRRPIVRQRSELPRRLDSSTREDTRVVVNGIHPPPLPAGMVATGESPYPLRPASIPGRDGTVASS